MSDEDKHVCLISTDFCRTNYNKWHPSKTEHFLFKGEKATSNVSAAL